jgi:hypothetical protein
MLPVPSMPVSWNRSSRGSYPSDPEIDGTRDGNTPRRLEFEIIETSLLESQVSNRYGRYKRL